MESIPKKQHLEIRFEYLGESGLRVELAEAVVAKEEEYESRRQITEDIQFFLRQLKDKRNRL